MNAFISVWNSCSIQRSNLYCMFNSNLLRFFSFCNILTVVSGFRVLTPHTSQLHPRRCTHSWPLSDVAEFVNGTCFFKWMFRGNDDWIVAQVLWFRMESPNNLLSHPLLSRVTHKKCPIHSFISNMAPTRCGMFLMLYTKTRNIFHPTTRFTITQHSVSCAS